VSLSSGIPPGNGKLRVRCLDSLPVTAAFLLFTVALQARQKNSAESFGMGLTVTVQASEGEILQAVQDVVADGIIQGSKEYNKDEYISGAEAVDSTPVFPNWTGPGRVFYKARKNALDPMNFKDSGDSGTLAIRYVVQPGDEKSAILKVDAIFVDDFHRRVHQSNGSVESAEYAAIQNHLATIHLQKQHSAEEDQGKKQELVAKELERDRKQQREDLAIAQSPDETLQQYVQRLRHEVERTVRSPGAQLRSAPFRSASSIGPLPAGARVVILISTPYWCGIETDGGQTGWVHRSQLELLP
jgi:Bacterial SH3 domain